MNNLIALLFSKRPETTDSPQLDYEESYARLVHFAVDRGIDIRFVFDSENFNDKSFNSYWNLTHGKLVFVNKSFQPDIVYVRGRIKDLSIKNRVNNPYLETICRDKLMTAKMLPLHVKKTVLLSPQTGSALHELQTDLIVVKPRFGANGRDVKVITKDRLQEADITGEDYIAQEFVDSSGGIKGVINARHELRLYVFNGEVKATYVRVPGKDSYLANIARGASEMQIDIRSVPGSAITLSKIVDKHFLRIKPRLYTIDIMVEDGKPWIVELNDNPGMPDVSVQPFTDNYLRELLTLLRTG